MSCNFRLIKVPGDGDCFYHAFSAGLVRLGARSIEASQLRNYVAKKIVTDPDLYDDIALEWLDFGIVKRRGANNQMVFTKTHEVLTPKRAAKRILQGDWATSTVIHILAGAFRVKVFVVENIGNKQYTESFPSAWKQRGKMEVASQCTERGIYLYKSAHHFDLLDRIDRLDESNKNHRSLQRERTGGGAHLPRNDATWHAVTLIVLFALYALQ